MFAFLDGFLEPIVNIVDQYLEEGYNFVNSLDALYKIGGVAAAGIIFFMGLWALIKTLSKIIIVVGVIAGLWFLYDSGALDSFIGG